MLIIFDVLVHRIVRGRAGRAYYGLTKETDELVSKLLKILGMTQIDDLNTQIMSIINL